MNGFLSDTWRDGLAVVGVALPLIQLLLSWATKKTSREPFFRLSTLETYRNRKLLDLDLDLDDAKQRRILLIALATTVPLMVLGSVFVRYNQLAELFELLMCIVAAAHEVSVIIFILHRFPALTARENERVVAPILFLTYIGLLVLAFWAISLGDAGTGHIARLHSPWWLGAVTAYAICYIFLAWLFSVREIKGLVARWRKK